jgi:hypothetical protein
MTKKELKNRDKLIKLLEKVKASFSFNQQPHVDKVLMEFFKANVIDLGVVLTKSYYFFELVFCESITDKMILKAKFL